MGLGVLTCVPVFIRDSKGNKDGYKERMAIALLKTRKLGLKLSNDLLRNLVEVAMTLIQ
jgi:hypothetical protein